jgi:hypothetical protein
LTQLSVTVTVARVWSPAGAAHWHQVFAAAAVGAVELPVERAAWMPIISALASEIGPPQIVKPLPLSVDISLVLATVTAVAAAARCHGCQ